MHYNPWLCFCFFPRDQCILLNHENFVKEAKEQDDVPLALDQLSKVIKEKEASLQTDNNNSPYPRVTFLGTGSSVPSKSRNVSCIVLHMR